MSELTARKEFFKLYRQEFIALFDALNKIPDKCLQQRVTACCGLKLFSSTETQTDSIETVSQSSQVNFNNIAGVSNELNLQNKVDPQKLFKVSIIRSFDKETQTRDTELIMPMIVKNVSKSDETPSNIISGKEIKLGRQKRINVPHVKKGPTPRISKTNTSNTINKKVQKLLHKSEGEKSSRVSLIRFI